MLTSVRTGMADPFLALLGLSAIDWIVIGSYFLVMIIIGLRSMRRIRNDDDYFLGGRRFGKLIQVFANFGQATSSDTAPTVATTTFHNGAAGVWSALMMLFATPVYWFTAVWYRRMRTTTLGDYYAQRYHSRAIGGIYALLMGIGLCVLLSLSFTVLVKTVQAMTPKDVATLTLSEQQESSRAERLIELHQRDFQSLGSSEQAELAHLQIERPRRQFPSLQAGAIIWTMVIVVALYAVTGGLAAAFFSDLIQGVFILLLSVLLIPFALSMVNTRYGGSGVMDAFRTLHQQKSESFFEIFGSPATADFTWYYVAAIAAMGLVNAGAQANTFLAPSSSKDEISARIGMTLGIYLKRFSTVLWGVTALFLVLLFGREITDPDLLWGYGSRALLAPLGIGLVGLMVAALMAALMSTADAFMITASGLFTCNIYQPLVPKRSSKHYLAVGRLLGIAVLLGAALLSIASESVLGTLKLWWEFGSLFAAAMWLGVLWKRTSRQAVTLQIGLCVLLFFVLPLALPAVVPSLRSGPKLIETTAARVLTIDYSHATAEDVEARQKEITNFATLPSPERIGRQTPSPLALGHAWSRTTVLPGKSIFWTAGLEPVTDAEGQINYRGRGRLNLFLLALDRAGLDLTHNSHALNETIRVLIRLLIPFVLLILGSLWTRRSSDEVAAADRLAARLLTPLAATPEEDARAVIEAEATPELHDASKLFGPASNWQFRKWSRLDTLGFAACLALVLLVIGLLVFLVGLGS